MHVHNYEISEQKLNMTPLGLVRNLILGGNLVGLDQVIEHNKQLVQHLIGPQFISALLRSIISDEFILETIAARSYRHINHFDKIVLLDDDDANGYRLTLHLWQPPYTEHEINDELIHDHRFSFWSGVILGDLRSENFMRMGGIGATNYREYRYIPEQKSKSNFYSFSGNVALRSEGIVTERKGSVYYLASDVIHRVIVPTLTTTCTLVLRGPRERQHSCVYNTSYPSNDTTIENTMFKPSELRDRLQSVAQQIGIPRSH